jgi:hypothetical protein
MDYERDMRNARYVVDLDQEDVDRMFSMWIGISSPQEQEMALSVFAKILEQADKITGSPRTVLLGIAIATFDNIIKEMKKNEGVVMQ